MKRFVPLALATLILAACGEKPKLIETVESLVANPERLNALRVECKADHAQVGDAQCNAVAEATRRRFMDSGRPPYADAPVRPPAPPVGTSKD
ncbi:MAG: EexN family lipoprotein [Thiobacillus sp.]|nr:EexN family lipoprotein [Thiobacillus sp.]